MKQFRHPIVLLLNFGAILFTVFLIPISTFAQAAVPASPEKKASTANAGPATPTVAEAEKFLARAEKTLSDLIIKANRASWVQSNFITDDTELLAADANKGAREMGFKDVGAMWRANYDMPPEALAAEMERLWLQVKPLYDSLYTYTRAQLVKKYGPQIVPPDGPIPAHLLGNMWSQTWGNIYPLLKPAGLWISTLSQSMRTGS